MFRFRQQLLYVYIIAYLTVIICITPYNSSFFTIYHCKNKAFRIKNQLDACLSSLTYSILIRKNVLYLFYSTERDTYMLDRTTQSPLYLQIAAELREAIHSGSIPPDAKLPSESEMMKQYGVGRITIRNALNVLLSEGLLIKHQGKGTFVRTVSSASSRVVTALLDMNNTYFVSYYVDGLREVMTEDKCHLNILDTSTDAGILFRRLESCLDSRDSGVIFQLAHHADEKTTEKLCRIANRFREYNIPCLMIDSYLSKADFSMVYFDDYGGGARVAEHLAAFRHKRCGVIYDPQYVDSSKRSVGFRTAAAEYGIEKVVMIEYHDNLEKTLVRTIRSENITGIFCYNDKIALKCMRLLSISGIRVPQDVSVIGFDDTYIAQSTDPHLTSISHPKTEMGRRCARAMLGLMDGSVKWPYTYIYPAYLVKRDTCTLRPRSV